MRVEFRVMTINTDLSATCDKLQVTAINVLYVCMCIHYRAFQDMLGSMSVRIRNMTFSQLVKSSNTMNFAMYFVSNKRKDVLFESY